MRRALILTALALALGCFPTREDIHEEVELAVAQCRDLSVALGAAATLVAETCLADPDPEHLDDLAEGMASVVLWRLGCVEVNDGVVGWDCTNSAFCQIDRSPSSEDGKAGSP
jgi:hypothetical protein